jgi:hypothetical protein
MKNLRRLGAAVVLTGLLGLSAFAGESSTPPCAPPEPGESSTPPCVAQMASNDTTTPGQMDTPPAPNTVEFLSVAEMAINLLLLF